MAPNTDCEWNYILWKGSGALTIQAHNSSFHDGDSAMMLLTWSAPATGPDRANARVMGDMAVAVITVTPQMQGGSVHVLARDTEALANGTYTAGTTFPQCASTIPVDYDDPAHAS
jgi:hypothetical protein